MALAHHLHDERLLDCYLAERGGETVDPPLAEHLAECGACGTRYADLVQFMEDLREGAEHESDAVFTPDQLRAQQQKILRRIEHVGRSARVISFPAAPVRGGIAAGTPRVATRWIAAAAAVGLFVGAAAGLFLDFTHADRQATQLASARTGRASARPTRLVDTTAPPSPSSEAADEAFLSELEAALDRPQTRELKPFDTLTPHVGLITNTIR